MFGIIFGSLVVVYGVLVMVDPLRFSLNALNDVFQKRLFGKKLYVLLGRFLGGPLCVGLGILLILVGLGVIDAGLN